MPAPTIRSGVTSYRNTQDSIEAADNEVSIQLGRTHGNGQSDWTEIQIAESYTWAESVFVQPNKFSITLGSSQSAQDILKAYPKGTAVQVLIAGIIQCTGHIYGREVQGDEHGTTVTLHGRDVLAKVHDAHVDAVTTFKNSTYTNLVWQVLLRLRLVTGTAVDETQLSVSNDANREVKVGIGNRIKLSKAAIDVDHIVIDGNTGNSTTPIVSQEIQANIGESWLMFLRRYLDPAGLTLWSAYDGTFVLSAPNANQSPIYKIVKRKTGSHKTGNIEWFHLIDDATNRHTEATTYGKGGGRAAGRTTALGSASDEDLINANAAITSASTVANSEGATGVTYTIVNGQRVYSDEGFSGASQGTIASTFNLTKQPNDPWFRDWPQIVSFREANCSTKEQAQNFGFRKLAEERREGFQLWYRFKGHTLPAIDGGGNAIVNPDTVVSVTDEELGLKDEPFYIESVERRRSPGTDTTVRLMRVGDVNLSTPNPNVNDGSEDPVG